MTQVTWLNDHVLKISEYPFFVLVEYDDNKNVEAVRVYDHDLMIFELTPTTLSVFSHYAPDRTPIYLSVSDDFDELPEYDVEGLVNGEVSVKDFVKGVLDYWYEVIGDVFDRLVEGFEE